MVRVALWTVAVVLAALSGCGKTSSSGEDGTRTASQPCDPPTMECEGRCADVATDSEHCGACGAPCPPGDVCVDGSCGSTGCPAGRHACDQLCVDLESNPLNCGACNTACTPPETCVEGGCTCAAPNGMCDGACVDATISSDHCGACGNACAPDEACIGGRCEPRCEPPLSYCGDRCVDLSNDPNACGGCDVVCESTELCSAGRCACPDDPSHAECDGCTDLKSNATHCGGCGNACPAGMRCEEGLCTACYDGFFFCPSGTGDPLETCLAQARTPAPSNGDAGERLDAASGSDASPAPQPPSPDLECQCQHCLVELVDCVSDPNCVSTWQCAMRNACTAPCWGLGGICSSGSTTGCFKFCPPSAGNTQTAARAEALMRCTTNNGCGF